MQHEPSKFGSSQTDFEFQPNDIYIMINGYGDERNFILHQLPAGKQWHRVIDTSLNSPADIVDEGKEVELAGNSYLVQAPSVAVCISKLNNEVKI